jgi:hypothetical protein
VCVDVLMCRVRAKKRTLCLPGIFYSVPVCVHVCVSWRHQRICRQFLWYEKKQQQREVVSQYSIHIQPSHQIILHNNLLKSRIEETMIVGTLLNAFITTVLLSVVPNVFAFTIPNQNKFIGRPLLSQVRG